MIITPELSQKIHEYQLNKLAINEMNTKGLLDDPEMVYLYLKEKKITSPVGVMMYFRVLYNMDLKEAKDKFYEINYKIAWE